MKQLEPIYYYLKLKEVYRVMPIKDRRESSAEHSWGCMVLADYFLPRIGEDLSREKIMDILKYHDFVEIEAGDTYFDDDAGLETQEQREQDAFEKIKSTIDEEIAKVYHNAFEEYRAWETREAKFAVAMDKIEPIFHRIYHDQIDIDEEILRKRQEKYMAEFPFVLKTYNEMLKYLVDTGKIKGMNKI